ncbi:HD domain-containing protein [Pectinatus frisingensis]|uniref:HD domain-containing protein n=1 Tax=Pectinatus frisingensis TaxID=865 RepID=UPI0015F57DAA|nr:HD domain-containing protein [Pectinatus frisingensis]
MKQIYIPRYNLILQHPLFHKHYKQILLWEKNRHFCHHDIAHFLAVARIAVIINNKEHYHIDEEIIYAAALLHDIGRCVQYETEVDHSAASVPIAQVILMDCKFSVEETSIISNAIKSHRDPAVKAEQNLSGLIYRADKMSRNCFCCMVSDQCNWPKEKRRSTLIY